MYRVGLFDGNWCSTCTIWDNVTSTEHNDFARKISREGTVLVKNEGALPVSGYNISVFGSNAGNGCITGGGGSGAVTGGYICCPLEGIKERYLGANYKEL